MFYFHPPTTMTLSSLYYRRPLDFELKKVHHLTITVRNTEYDGALGLVTKQITVRVVDQNEHIPKFIAHSNVMTVKENTPVGTSIEHFNATDLDSNQQLVFSLAQTPNNEFFRIDENTGELFVAGNLDYEKIREMFLIPVVEDGLYRSFKEIVIKIENENDNHPFFTKAKYLVNVTENVTPGSHLLKLDVTDLDLEDVYGIHLEITNGNEENIFGVATTNLIVKEKLITGKEYTLKMRAYDKGGLRSSNEALVEVNVVRDPSRYTTTRAPYLKVFREDFYDVLLLESTKVGSVIHQFDVYDANEPLIFRLKEIGTFQKSSFQITNKGSIVLSSILDLRDLRTHYLVISACTNYNGKETCELCQVTIKIKEDPNDWPRFESKHYKASISELSEPGNLLTILRMRGRLKKGVKLKILDDVFNQTYIKKSKQNAKLYLNSTLNHTLQSLFRLTVVMYREPYHVIDQCTVEVRVIKAGLHDGVVKISYDPEETGILRWKYLVLLVSLIMILVLLLIVCMLLKQAKR